MLSNKLNKNLYEGINALNTDNMTWAGRATNVTETWTLSKLLKYEYIMYNNSERDGLSHDQGYLEDQYTNYFYLCNFLNLNKPGYVPSFIDKTNPLWVPKVNWVSLRSTGATQLSSNWNTGDCISVSAIPSIEYESNSDGKKFIYEHIINYKNDTAWEVAAKNVTNYVKDTTNNTLGTAGWTSEVETNGEMDGEWSGFESGESTKVYSITRGNSSFRGIKTDQDVYLIDENPDSSHSTNNKSIPVIGLIGTYNSNQIYQFTKDDVVDEDGVRLNPVYLHQGLPIMQVKEDEIIEWEPTFKDIKVSGILGVSECKIILSYVPFTIRQLYQIQMIM